MQNGTQAVQPEGDIAGCSPLMVRPYDIGCDSPAKTHTRSLSLDGGQSLQGIWCRVQAYTLQRLVRGLASSRQGARQGFALALTAVVQQANGPSVDACISLISKQHAVTNSMPVRPTCNKIRNVLAASHAAIGLSA